MKNRKNIILGVICVLALLMLVTIWFFSIGKPEVASYENYVIGGLGGFLILENLVIPFFLSVFMLVISGTILIYRIVKKK